jgi:hypothetical protein
MAESARGVLVNARTVPPRVHLQYRPANPTPIQTEEAKLAPTHPGETAERRRKWIYMISRLVDLSGYTTVQELSRAHSEGRAFLAVDQSFSMQWTQLPEANPSRSEVIFHYTLSWAMVWVGLFMATLAWHSLGAKALLLTLVSLLAGFWCRPWRWLLTWPVALLAFIFSDGLFSWIGGTWLLTAFLVSGWITWCANRLTERLLQNEALLVWALQPRGPNQLHEGPVAFIRAGKI